MCKIHLPKIEYVKMVQRGLYIELRKKFQGIELIYFYELVTKVAEYVELLREENQRKKTSIGSYYQEVTNEEVAMVDLVNIASHI